MRAYARTKVESGHFGGGKRQNGSAIARILHMHNEQNAKKRKKYCYR